MKKSIIAAGAASAVLAAMPVVGAFAATEQNSLTERLSVTVDTSCQMSVTMGSAVSEGTGWAVTDNSVTAPNYDFTYTTKVANGASTGNITGSTVKVICNDAGGWYVNAAGISGNTTLAATINDQNPAIATAQKADSGEGTNNYTSATTSAWGFKLTAADNQTYAPTIVSTYQNIAAVPASGTKVVSGPRTDKKDTAANTTGSVFTTNYEVYVSPDQPADTYKGGVIYTLYNPNN